MQVSIKGYNPNEVELLSMKACMAHELFSSLLDTLQEQIGRGVDESKENSSRLLN